MIDMSVKAKAKDLPVEQIQTTKNRRWMSGLQYIFIYIMY